MVYAPDPGAERMSNILPVILAGGASSRLWPLSDRNHPKWDLRLFGPKSLLEDAWARGRALAHARDCFVVAGAVHAKRIRECLPDLPEANLLLEPEGRDTAGAIAFAAGVLSARDPDGVMLLLPSDHLIKDVAGFAACARTACDVSASSNALATFGLTPQHPAICYGYIHRGATAGPAYRVQAFKEKPDAVTAEGYVRSGEYYWNSGIFAFHLKTLRTEFERQMPAHAALLTALTKSPDTAARERALKESFLPLKKISIDYGIMEHAQTVLVVPAAFDWDDIGSWSAVAQHLPAQAGQAVGPGVHLETLDANGNLVIAPGRRVALIGVENIAVVDSPQGLLVCRLAQDQSVKQVAQRMEP
jgi:mannose-1-phosphate guanylyltransferase